MSRTELYARFLFFCFRHGMAGVSHHPAPQNGKMRGVPARWGDPARGIPTLLDPYRPKNTMSRIPTPPRAGTPPFCQAPKSTHHPHKIGDRHRVCKTGGGAYFAFVLGSDNLYTPPPKKKTTRWERSFVGMVRGSRSPILAGTLLHFFGKGQGARGPGLRGGPGFSNCGQFGRGNTTSRVPPTSQDPSPLLIKKGEAFLLTVGVFCLQLSFFAYSPWRPLLDALSHCKQKSSNCK